MHSRRIVRLLQEIIVEESVRIYNDQTFAMSRTEYVESGFDPLPDPCINIQDDELTSRDPKTRYPMGWEELDNKLQQFTLWQKALDDDPETDLDIIKSYLVPLTYFILQDVCNFLRFLTLDMRTDSPGFHYAHLGIELKSGQLEADAKVSLMGRKKIGECNILLFKLSREVERLKLARFGGIPAMVADHPPIMQPNATEPAPAAQANQWHELGRLRIRADFLEVRRGEQKWILTLPQARALQFVHEKHQAGISIHQKLVLRHIGSPSARLREAFRSKKGLYKALFTTGDEKGHVRLNA